MRFRSRFIFADRCPAFPEPLVEKATLPPLYCFCTFDKDQLSICVWVYHLGCLFWALIYVSVMLPVPHSWFLYPDSKINGLTLFFFFKMVLHILLPVPFHINFGINFSVTTKLLAGIPIKIASNLLINWSVWWEKTPLYLSQSWEGRGAFSLLPLSMVLSVDFLKLPLFLFCWELSLWISVGLYQVVL